MSEECEFDCDPSGPNNDVHAGRCPIYLEARIAALESSLRESEARLARAEKVVDALHRWRVFSYIGYLIGSRCSEN